MKHIYLFLMIFLSFNLCADDNKKEIKIDYEAIAKTAKEEFKDVRLKEKEVALVELELAKKDLEHRMSLLKHREMSFYWHLISTIIIFIMVIVVIGTGLYFSYIQLKTKNNETPQTSIKISKEGLEINSPFIGLLILGLSFVFFYIYLKDVYPITEINLSNPKTTVEAPKQDKPIDK